MSNFNKFTQILHILARKRPKNEKFKNLLILSESYSGVNFNLNIFQCLESASEVILRKTHFSENLVNFHEILVKNVFISPKRLQNTILLMCNYCYYLVLTFYRPKTMSRLIA